MKVIITTPYVSTNALYTHTRHGRKVKTATAREAKEAIYWEAKSQIKRDPFKDEVKVQIHLFFPDNRKRDIDNIKGLIDALTGVCWVDDSQIVDLHILKYVDKNRPRAEITVSR
jgi:Holliday junction resolvase RusA-like endonuclease